MSERRCPLSYERLSSNEEFYSLAGLRRLSPRLQTLAVLPFNHQDLLHEAGARVDKMSIGGVQPKVSAILRIAAGQFELVDQLGTYILKPHNPYFTQIPENEDVTMRMAAAAGIPVPFHGLIYSLDKTLCYVIQRFDRIGRKKRLAVEDFGQLLGLDRESKYDASMEKIAEVVERYCTFPAIEKVDLFRRVLVAFLTGNEDMHVKNFSILTTEDGLRRLSPAYDFVNTTLVMGNAREETALHLAGKKSRFNREHFIDYYGRERLGLSEQAINRVIVQLAQAQPVWEDLLERSFLSLENKNLYADLLAERRSRLGLPSA